jgi:ribosomal-protein-alanine N-acetyltransferase
MRLFRLFARTAPQLALARPGDAASFAKLHATSFGRGWTEDEFERLLLDPNVLAHRAGSGRDLKGFIISRLAGDEAEILSVAVAASQRGRGLAGGLLDLHLRTLVGRGARAIFLEVDEDNAAARRLYARRHFREVGRRRAYYPRPNGGSGALVLRRDLG